MTTAFIGFASRRQADAFLTLLAQVEAPRPTRGWEPTEKSGWWYAVFADTAVTRALVVGYCFNRTSGCVRGTGEP